jgi:hypothetical protein
MYTTTNFKTLKALREAVDSGHTVTYFQPGPYMGHYKEKMDGDIFLEGPHYPEPHKWYARAKAEGGRIVKVYKR